VNGFRKYYIGYITGILLSIAAGITVGILVDFASLQSIRVFFFATWTVALIAAMTATALGIYNSYNYNNTLAKQLKNHILLLIIGLTATIIITSITALMIDMGIITVVALKVLTSFSVLSVGLVLTAVFSFIYWVIKKASCIAER
jgi:hypothetical protein